MNLDKNLYTGISMPAEQGYLADQRPFHLSEVLKLRCEVKKSEAQLVILQITPYVLNQILIKIYIHVF